MTSSLYYAIDVSKERLQLGSQVQSLKSFANTTRGHQSLIEFLQKRDVTAIALEATGIYSLAISDALASHGFETFLVQPARMKAFARSQGVWAKSDPIDAQLIAGFLAASHAKLRPYEPTSKEMRRLRDLISRRDQIVDDRKREKTRLEACVSAEISRRINKSIRALDKEIKDLDGKIDDLIKSNETLQEKRQILESVKGVGKQTSASLLVFLPELGLLNREQIAALVGLAPYTQESGRWRGQRKIRGGRSRVRWGIYMSAVTASWANPVLKEVYQRLLKNGKKKKVAMVAIARKMLIHLNTLMSKHFDGVLPEGQQA